MFLKSAFLVLSILASPFNNGDGTLPPNANPTMNLSAVRYIECDEWTGSGFLIGDKMLLTANHVLASGKNCKDAESGSPLTVYKQDKEHDLVLATGPDLPTDIPYVKIACEPFKKGEAYSAYGYSGYMQSRPILRENTLIADEMGEVTLSDGTVMKPIRNFVTAQAPGMSGGPITDRWGYVHGVVNAGNAYRSFNYQLSDGMMCKH